MEEAHNGAKSKETLELVGGYQKIKSKKVV
jgi:hypothetical protein